MYATSYLHFPKILLCNSYTVLHVLNVSCELLNSVSNSFGSRTTGITEDLMSSPSRVSTRLAVEEPGEPCRSQRRKGGVARAK
ncbi:unnamed protein product [Lasius platythorax]|uniref:Uncharacterized protein n=1 Tax=Lasius platythorax TaxID=488582 RepID=A0AAV2NKA1_9HYME